MAACWILQASIEIVKKMQIMIINGGTYWNHG
jgi:hypothetical protein